MKGIILAGGLGTRLRPLTNRTNKHLLSVAGHPMIFYPLGCLVTAGIDEILIVTGEEHMEAFKEVLGDGCALGARSLTLAAQQGEKGIADALRRGESFAAGERVCVVLGDNIVEWSIRGAAERFAAQPRGARMLVTRVQHPREYGVARFEGDRLFEVVEKPAVPPSDMVVTGIYFYDTRVFDIIRSLKPSARGELEISDVNNDYARRGEAEWEEIRGWWVDAGTPEGLQRAEQLIGRAGANRTA